jgi:hypothetical protein
MAASGEPYSVAARKLASAEPPDGTAALREVVVRLHSTLSASSARMEYRTDIVLPPDVTPGERLVGKVLKTVWERVVPEGFRTRMREAGREVAQGIVEPAAGRYQMIYHTGFAKMCVDGQHYTGLHGGALEDWTKDRSQAPHKDDPLAWLKLLQGVTEARYTGNETLRGTPCRKIILSKILLAMRPARPEEARSAKEDSRSDLAEFTVWIDEEYVRQVQAAEGPGNMETRTLELWDFGVQDDSVDWAHFPERAEQASAGS